MNRYIATPLIAVSVAVGVSSTGTGVTIAAPPAESSMCRMHPTSPVASGLGILENLAFDGRGRLLLSQQTPAGPGGAVLSMRHGGSPRVLVGNVTAPGGIVVNGDNVFVATGDSAVSGAIGRRDGTVLRVSPTTGRTAVVARGLVQPNGLAQLADGRLITSRDIGPDTMLTATDHAGHFGPATLTSTNGLATDATRTRLYVTSTFTSQSTVTVLDASGSGHEVARYTIPGIGPLNSADDLTVDHRGFIYVALNAAGRVVRIDPTDGRTCTIAENLPLTSSVRFGSGAGWDPNSLYATSFLGTVTRIHSILR